MIIWNMHTQSEEKSDDSKGSFYDELKQVFSHFPKSSSLVFSPKAGYGRNQSPVRRPVWLWHTKYHMKILLEDFNVKLGRERQSIFKPTIGTERLAMIMVLE